MTPKRNEDNNTNCINEFMIEKCKHISNLVEYIANIYRLERLSLSLLSLSRLAREENKHSDVLNQYLSIPGITNL